MLISKINQEFVDTLLSATNELDCSLSFLTVLSDYQELVREHASLQKQLANNSKAINKCLTWFEACQFVSKE
tara:strand:+ start:471 stop:686 length:216 start_codon:yes stop_codon:yes gene_type:complete